jgi:hypothetical protein
MAQFHGNAFSRLRKRRTERKEIAIMLHGPTFKDKEKGT